MWLPRTDQGQKRRARAGRASALLLVGGDVGDLLEIDVVLLVLEDLVVEISQEGLQAWLDENPEERKRLAAEKSKAAG